MATYLLLLLISSTIGSLHCKSLFDIQDTLTILCRHFPLVPTANTSDVQCARLRINENEPSIDAVNSNFTNFSLFVIIDRSTPVDDSPVNVVLSIDEQTWNVSSPVTDIRLSLLVADSSFIVNNQSASIYAQNQVPIFHWSKSNPDVYTLTDVLTLDTPGYRTDTDMCDWNWNRWTRIFNDSTSSHAYVIKAANTNLTFALADAQNVSALSPYLQILYCIPYRFDTIEVAVVVTFSILFLLFMATASALHFRKHSQKPTKYILPTASPQANHLDPPPASSQHLE